MTPRELAPGLWSWAALHPEWKPDYGGTGGWEQEVSSWLLDEGERVVLIDPLLPQDAALTRWLDQRVDGRPVDVLITVYWHLRSAEAVRERYGATVWSNPKTREEVEELVGGVMADGVPLPGGVVPFAPIPNDDGEDETALWLPRQRALAVGDILIQTPGGLRVWWTDASRGEYDERFRPALRRLLELPIELLRVPHGGAVTTDARTALAEALEAPTWQRD